jgi:hypothetical protein
MKLDFTVQKYEDLCRALTTKNVVTVESYLTHKPKSNFIILRHDVDRKLNNALKISKLENNYNIKSTYYFRVNGGLDAQIIREIKKLGHEVGYHYEILSKTNGNYEKAIILFEKELSQLRDICEINTICMHGSPASKYNNLTLWNKFDFKEYKILGEALLSISDVFYFTDSGHSWDRKNNLRDHLSGEIKPVKRIKNTDKLIDELSEKKNYYINTHPEHWASNYFEYVVNNSVNLVFNIGKNILAHSRAQQ